MAGSTPAKVDASAGPRRPRMDAPIAGAGGLTAAEGVLLLGAAMRSREPVTFLKAREDAFNGVGREGDALLACVIRALLASGEIETLMFMRAEWLGRRPAGRRWVRGRG